MQFTKPQKAPITNSLAHHLLELTRAIDALLLTLNQSPLTTQERQSIARPLLSARATVLRLSIPKIK
jgi:hypothetical protein